MKKYDCDLKTFINDKTFEKTKIVKIKIAKDILNGLLALNGNSFLHGDLKLENILLNVFDYINKKKN